MDENPIYLDYNATTPIHPEVAKKIGEVAGNGWFQGAFGNPSSTHAYGQKAHHEVEHARNMIAQMLKCKSNELVFTSCGTESNNISILGACELFQQKYPSKPPRIVISAVEHPATMETCEFASKKYNAEIIKVPVDGDGQIVVDDVLSRINENTCLISIMYANNEVGTLLNVSGTFGKIVEKRGSNVFPILHTDCAQAIGKIPVHVDVLHCDLLSVAGHKLYAPKGVGVLFIRNGKLIPNVILHGAGQENGMRPGTENVIHIAALGKAAELTSELPERIKNSSSLVYTLYKALKTNCNPSMEVKVNGPLARHIESNDFIQRSEKLALNVENPAEALQELECLPNTLSISLIGAGAHAILASVSDKVCASVGSACHSSTAAMSSVLKAMNFTPERAFGTFRFSVGCGLTEEMVVDAGKIICDAINSSL